MDPSPGFEKDFGDQCCKFRKALYGLKESLIHGLRNLQRLEKKRFKKGNNHHTMFFKHSNDGKVAVLIVYVHDTIITKDYEDEIVRSKGSLASEFELMDLG